MIGIKAQRVTIGTWGIGITPRTEVFLCPCGDELTLTGTGNWDIAIKKCPKCGQRVIVRAPDRDGFIAGLVVGPKIKWDELKVRKYPILERAKEKAKLGPERE